MISPKLPDNESSRQREVEKYKLLDTLAEESYDNITSLISFITNTPISLITLLDDDRNFIKSNCGFPLSESPRTLSFCGHAINAEEDIMIVEDARKDERFHDNPLVSDHKAIFYAGVPLVNPNGFKLGTLCVYDHEPRQLNDDQIKALKSLSKQVVNLLELRLLNSEMLESKKALEIRNKELNKFANVISHDLKSPLANITSLIELLEEENEDVFNETSKEYLEYLKSSSTALKNYIDGTLKYYKSYNLIDKKHESISASNLINEAKLIATPKNNVNIKLTQKVENLFINKHVLLQILLNLFTNAMKYNDENIIDIIIDCYEDKSFYYFKVKDNGQGIPNDKIPTLFDLFTTVGSKDREGNTGTGIGLALVKKLVENQGGEISVESTVGFGSIFTFSIEKSFSNTEVIENVTQ